jgi:hypothetical protein
MGIKLMREFRPTKLIDDMFYQQQQVIIHEINSQTPEELLGMSSERYADYLSQTYAFDVPTILENKVTMSSYEDDIPGSNFPPEFGILDRSKNIKRDVVVFHLPFSGGIAILDYLPSTLLTDIPIGIEVRNEELLFAYIKFYEDPLVIKKEYEADLDAFRRYFYLINRRIEEFNNSLKDFALNTINKRRDSLISKNAYLAAFNIPLKSKSDISQTFCVPSPKLREKIKISKPALQNLGFTPEPFLDYENYSKILKIINDVGQNFERLPSIYKTKGEEDLRDFILFVLDPNFELGSATGETFNMAGKTDILLRYDSSVVFVAECKFWTGEKGFLETIDQLLSYLTWRNSKTAIIIFVKNKEIIPVFNKIKEVISTHKCYLSTNGDKAENWIEYVFCLPIDKNKEIILTILIFHLPDIEK